MKTDVGHLPQAKQRELELIVQILMEEFEDAMRLALSEKRKAGRVLAIILYGSFARGTWVEDRASGYFSDYDILIVVNQDELTDIVDYWSKAEDRIMHHPGIKREVQLIVHTLQDVNDQLARGQYFFKDIKEEGIELYRQRGTRLAEPKELPRELAYDVAKEHFDIWMPSAGEFYDDFASNLERGRLNKSAFELHQTVERAYACYLLVHTNYRPQVQNIEFLRSLSESHDRSLVDIWPRYHRQDRRLFQLLKKAYVEARYSKHYAITKEELSWLGGRVAELLPLIEERCLARLDALKRA